MHHAVIALFLSGITATRVAGQPVLFNTTDSTTVTGKIDGYSTKQEQQFISYYVYDIAGDKAKFAAPLQPNGKFSFRFLQPYEGEFDLQYGASSIKLYAQPGENIQVKIDHDVSDKVYHFPGAYKIEGRSAMISTHILKFFAQYLPMMQERSAGISMKLSTAEFVGLTHRNLQSDIGLLTAYSNKNHPPVTFRVWMEHYLTYEAASQILLKPFLDPDLKNATDADLTAFLRNIKINDETGLHNSSYYAFLVKWVNGVHMNLGKGQERAELTVTAKEALEKIDSHLDGVAREIAYYHSYAWDASSELATFRLEQIWERFDTVITDNFIQQALEATRNSLLETFVPFNISERISKISTNTATSKKLLSILEQEKGNFIYIDFWGKWCAPCMAEMPDYPRFIEQFNGKPIHFLFLSVRTSENDSKAVQQKYSIPAQFFVLNKNETDIVNQAFGFSSYPSNFIIDPDGNLVTKNIRPLNRKDAADMIRMLMAKEKTPR